MSTNDKPTKVYLLVECDVEDPGCVKGDHAESRAARTLNDALRRGDEPTTDDGKVQFNLRGRIDIGYASIIMPDRVEILRAESKRHDTMPIKEALILHTFRELVRELEEIDEDDYV